MKDTKTSEHLNLSLLPQHVAIIMDGNRRWAKSKGLPVVAGHKEGLTAAKAIVKEASILGIKYITLYTFSKENWKRTEEEVGYLMGLIKQHLKAEFTFYKENKIKVCHIGDLSTLPPAIQKEIIEVKKETSTFEGTQVVLAINYSGRDEIVRAVRKYLSSSPPPSPSSPTPSSSLSSLTDNFSEETLDSFMDYPALPPVDLLIRTGGEERISNFLLWQASYAELIFTKTLWPAYTKEEFIANLQEYEKRQRRFGK